MSEKILIFGGTTEGRELAAFLERCGVRAHVCVATDYGAELLEREQTHHTVHAGRIDAEGMKALIRAEDISIVIDATHPYARDVSANIAGACDETGCRRIRLLRAGSGAHRHVDSVQEAARLLAETEGNVLVSTGSKELAAFTEIPGYESRVFARVLSTPESVQAAAALGFTGRNLIAMQGPFSTEMNVAQLRAVHARYLVTKESGRAGGFPEKEEAARIAGAELIVIGRPQEQAGECLGPMEVRRRLIRELGLSPRRHAVLAGIGPGRPEGMTVEVHEAIRGAQLLVGAGRMLAAAGGESGARMPAAAGGEQETLCEYRPEKIAAFLEEHPEYEEIAVLLSGDVGFYSGAGKIAAALGGIGCACEFLPGIPTVAALCARVQVPWEDVKLISRHGRSANLAAAVRENRRVFALAGRQEDFRQMCRELIEFGLGEVSMAVGRDLSYPEEQIFRGTPQELLTAEVGDLTAVLIENGSASARAGSLIPDEAFIRILGGGAAETVSAHADSGLPEGAASVRPVPMTKSEIRTLSLAKLDLRRGSVVYDIGAGSGSVSVEAALQACDGQVYAIEQRPEAAALIRENARRFGAANIEVICGSAPEALEGPEAPSHAFLGGTSGNMRAILAALLEKNPAVRVVINAVTIETVAAAIEGLRELRFSEPEVVCVSVAKARRAGSLHMMIGQNPVYILTADGPGKA